jgi:hypothetical protein
MQILREQLVLKNGLAKKNRGVNYDHITNIVKEWRNNPTNQPDLETGIRELLMENMNYKKTILMI